MLMLIVAVIMIAAGCNEPQNKSDKVLNQQQEQLMQEANRQVGMPAIKNFQERKLLKMVLELRDQEHLICFAYLWNEFNGKLVFIGKCEGYGIPYATEFTNPVKRSHDDEYSHDYGYEIPQADPNGLFMPQTAEATWIMLLRW